MGFRFRCRGRARQTKNDPARQTSSQLPVATRIEEGKETSTPHGSESSWSQSVARGRRSLR